MTQPVGDQLNVFLHDGDKTIWSTAALVLAIQGAASDEQQAAAHAVLEASGLDGVASLGPEEAGGLAAQAAAPIHQVACLLRGEGQMWATQSDEALVAQGRASAQGAAAFAQFGLPMLAGLVRRSPVGLECSTSAPGSPPWLWPMRAVPSPDGRRD